MLRSRTQSAPALTLQRQLSKRNSFITECIAPINTCLDQVTASALLPISSLRLVPSMEIPRKLGDLRLVRQRRQVDGPLFRASIVTIRRYPGRRRSPSTHTPSTLIREVITLMAWPPSLTKWGPIRMPSTTPASHRTPRTSGRKPRTAAPFLGTTQSSFSQSWK